MQHMTRHTNTHTHTCNSYCVLQHTHIAHTTRFRMQECNPERETEKENEIKVGRKCALTGIIYNQANITGTKIRTRMRMCTFLTKIRTATTSAAKAHSN